MQLKTALVLCCYGPEVVDMRSSAGEGASWEGKAAADKTSSVLRVLTQT